MPSASRQGIRALGVTILLCIATQNCSSTDGLGRVQLAETCALNSDCNPPFVCAFETCHEACQSTRDCPAGARCIAGERPLHVCQRTAVAACTHHSDCPLAQVCGTDGQCRDACVTARDCLADQRCLSGSCADEAELVSGALPWAAVGDSRGQACVHSSDCPGNLVCLFNRRCDVECNTNKDCFVSWTCIATRCHPPGTTVTPDGGTAETSDASATSDASVTDTSDTSISDVPDTTPSSDAAVSCVTITGSPSAVVASSSLGYSNACAVRPDGTLWCWGYNFYGQLGDGTTTSRISPVQVTALGASVSTVKMGESHTCARKTDGTLWCWGNNVSGQLGDGTTTNRSVPVQIGALGTNVVAVAAGTNHSCARKGDGTLWCWGMNVDGQLGDGTTTDRVLPVQVTALGTSVTTVVAASKHTCARKTEGTLWCWGYNWYGQLGDGTGTSHTSPVQVVALGANVAEVSAGGYHSCARKTDNTLWCFGWNGNGQLGDGSITDRIAPVQVTALGANVAESSAGAMHTCARKTDGTLWCWGWNFNGQVGDGSTTDRFVPTQVSTLGTTAVGVTAGSAHTCARRTDGTLWCWGDNAYGQLGDGTSTQRTTAVVTRVPCP